MVHVTDELIVNTALPQRKTEAVTSMCFQHSCQSIKCPSTFAAATVTRAFPLTHDRRSVLALTADRPHVHLAACLVTLSSLNHRNQHLRAPHFQRDEQSYLDTNPYQRETNTPLKMRSKFKDEHVSVPSSW